LQFGSGPSDNGMPWGASATITLTTQVDAAAAGGLVTNVATVGGPGLDMSPGNESDSASVDIKIVPTPTPTATYTPTPTKTPTATATPTHTPTSTSTST